MKNVARNTYAFSAVRGEQAGNAFYIAMCDMKSITTIPELDMDGLPEHKAQRTLRKSRIPKIRDYLLQNPDNYIFSSITVSVDGKISFNPVSKDSDLGTISIALNATILINDGQHRVRAIQEAIKEDPKIGNDCISVVFFEDQNLVKSQQMFADLNKHALKPTKSLGILYDHRNDFASFVVDMSKQLKIFNGKIEMEKTSISNRSTKFFSLSGLAAATRQLLGKEKHLTENEKAFAMAFWKTVSKFIPQWQLLMDNKMSPYEMRSKYIHAHSNTLEAIATAGNALKKKYGNEWKRKLAGLRDIEWSKDNEEWQGNILNGNKMRKTREGMNDAAQVILKHCEVGK